MHDFVNFIKHALTPQLEVHQSAPAWIAVSIIISSGSSTGASEAGITGGAGKEGRAQRAGRVGRVGRDNKR